eukprot:scaffold1924_cov218-Amphora_coffeaeformis.AAC.2
MKSVSIAFLLQVLATSPLAARADSSWKRSTPVKVPLSLSKQTFLDKALEIKGGSQGSRNGKDSPQQLAEDVAKVLHELRPQKYDPAVPKIFHSTLRPTFAVTWTHQMWERHTSRWRFFNNILYWPFSALIWRILPQLLVLMGWTYFALRLIQADKITPLDTVSFPMTSLSLVSGFVASLLALRSNQGLSRLMEARLLFGKVVLYSRDMSSLMKHFVYHGNPDLALKMARHVSIFSWVLKNFLRGRKVTGDDEDIIRTMLPHPADADYVLSQRKMPVAIVMRLRQALAHLSHAKALSTAEEMAIDHTIQSMDSIIMLSERLVASPIPPLFTTHAARLLTFYLFFLPVALHSTGSLNEVGIYVTVAAVGFAMLGLDEISHLMEQPFKLAPLYHLCKNAMRDVADAFCLPVPSLAEKQNGDYDVQAKTPLPYWGPSIGLEKE